MSNRAFKLRLIALVLICVTFLSSCLGISDSVDRNVSDGKENSMQDSSLHTESIEIDTSLISSEKPTEPTEDGKLNDDTDNNVNDTDNTAPDDSDGAEDNKDVPSQDGDDKNDPDSSGQQTQICEHSFGDWVTVIPPRCLGVEGSEEAECSLCGAKKQRTVSVEGHISVVDDPAKDATCDQTGLTAGKHCESCGTVLLKQTVVPLRSHTYDDDEDESCNLCPYVRSVSCKHSFKVTLPGKQATCTESGLTDGLKCLRCFEILLEQTVIEAKGHEEVVIKGYAATENGWGLTDGVKCSVCTTVLVEQKSVFPTGYTNIERYVDDYGYKSLLQFTNGKKMQELYNRLDETSKKFHTDFSQNAVKSSGLYIVGTFKYSDLGLTLDEATAVWSFFRHDHPLYYWYSAIFAYDAANSKICIVTDEEYAKGSDRAIYNKTVFESAKSYVALADGETSAYRIALAFHDAIIRDIDYAYKADGKTPEVAGWAHSILGVFDNKRGVCESYAKTFQLLLNYCEVDNVYVTGVSNGVSHAWNIVQMDDGKWYWFDLTWDDRPNWMWGISYNYFCVSNTDNVNRIDGPWLQGTSQSFLQTHTPYLPTTAGVNCQYTLPNVSDEAASLDLTMLRNTFEIDGLKYAVVGYNAVQLIGINNVTDVNIPETVKYGGATYRVVSIGAMSERLIRTGAIADESASIRTVNIPKSVIFIWDGALALKNLIRITVDAKNTVYTSQDGVLFTKSLYTLIQYPMGSPEKAYTIPDSTFEVAHMSFGNAEKGALRALTVGKSVATVGTMNAGYGYRDSADSAPLNFAVGEWFYISTFMNLSGVVTIDEENTSFTVYKGAVYDSEMTELYLVFDKSITEYDAPDSLLIIDVGAFYYCRYLKTVSLPSNLIEIRVYAFGFCNISSLFYDGGGDEWNEIRKEDGWNYRASIQAYRFSD